MNLAVFQGTIFASIGIKYYATGSLIPYASTRLKDFLISSFQFSVSPGGGSIIESVSIKFDNYGFKDWVNNLEFGYSTITHTVTTY